ncbi:MAG: D-tyrosyl-tRNA(Tyr) deacylase [Bacteroidetes bacterium]|nr:D-tyrosyl-tRNA(Tyr) deacylase [Bacteroidota bacterium]
MRALVQRVSEGSVAIEWTRYAHIEKGFVILLGIRKGDTAESALSLADKCATLRVFEGGEGKMNLGLMDVHGAVLIVSQFTLYADTQRGNRPGFADAAQPEEAEPLYEQFVARMRAALGSDKVFTGVFRAMMQVTIVNDGPVTILLERA